MITMANGGKSAKIGAGAVQRPEETDNLDFPPAKIKIGRDRIFQVEQIEITNDGKVYLKGARGSILLGWFSAQGFSISTRLETKENLLRRLGATCTEDLGKIKRGRYQ